MTTRPIAATGETATVVTQAGAASDRSARDMPRQEPRVAEYDVVDDTGAASFPASDPPSWWGGG